MRRKLMITLLTMTMAASLFVGCGTSETVETPVEEETVVEETVEDPEVVESEEENTTVETEETNESEETAESETVAKPKEEVAEPEVAENKKETKTKTDTKKETEKKDTTTTTSTSTTNTNTNTNNNIPTPAPTPEPTPAPEPTPSKNNTTTPVVETPAAPAAPAAPTGWNCSTQGHKMSSTVIDMVGHTIEQGTGQYEQVQVDSIPGEPIYDTNPDSPTFGNCIGFTPETPVYETREITTTVLVHTTTLQDTCSVCGYSTTRTVTE